MQQLIIVYLIEICDTQWGKTAAKLSLFPPWIFMWLIFIYKSIQFICKSRLAIYRVFGACKSAKWVSIFIYFGVSKFFLIKIIWNKKKILFYYALIQVMVEGLLVVKNFFFDKMAAFKKKNVFLVKQFPL